VCFYVSRCSCLNWQPASIDSREVIQAAEQVVAMINSMTSSEAGLCARLRVGDVMSAVRYVTSADMLRYRGSVDLDGRVGDFTDDMKPNNVRLATVSQNDSPLLSVSIAVMQLSSSLGA